MAARVEVVLAADEREALERWDRRPSRATISWTRSPRSRVAKLRCIPMVEIVPARDGSDEFGLGAR